MQTVRQAQKARQAMRTVRQATRTLGQDLRYSVRMLLKHPAYTLIAVITLALGIGANAAIFSIINDVLLRSLPYQEPDRIITLWENNTKENIPRDDVSPANFLDLRERQQVFSEIAFANPDSMDYVGGGEPEVIRAAMVSNRLFPGFWRQRTLWPHIPGRRISWLEGIEWSS